MGSINPQTDEEAAIELIDLIDNEGARVAVCAALAICFEGKAKWELWNGLSNEQKGRLKK